MVVLSSIIRIYGLSEVSIGEVVASAHEYSGRSSGMSYSAGSKIEWIKDSAHAFQLRKCSSESISSNDERLCLIWSKSEERWLPYLLLKYLSTNVGSCFWRKINYKQN